MIFVAIFDKILRQMKLNGWQRLWVVLTALWMLPNAFFAYSNWPTTKQISKLDAYSQLSNEDGERLTDYFDVLITKYGGEAADDPRVTQLRQDKEFQAASVKDQKAYLTATDSHFAKSSTVNQNAYLGFVTGITGPVVDIEGHTVTFVRDLSKSDMDKTADAYHSILKTILRHRRYEVLGRAAVLWIGPAGGLYIFGFAIAWVRRGFTAN